MSILLHISSIIPDVTFTMLLFITFGISPSSILTILLSTAPTVKLDKYKTLDSLYNRY